MNDTIIDCPNCRYDTVYMCDEPCYKCSLSHSEYEPQPPPRSCVKCRYYHINICDSPCLDCFCGCGKPNYEPEPEPPTPGANTAIADEPTPTPIPPPGKRCRNCRYYSVAAWEAPCSNCCTDNTNYEPKPQPADPDAPDLCDKCSFVFSDSTHCRNCDGRSNYTADADPDSTGAVGDVEQQAIPKRAVYAAAHDAIDLIEAMARVSGIAAERIEVKVDTKRCSATVRGEDYDEVTFSRRVGEK